ncbi:MAG: hypothetical protein AAB697_01715 [Patescibacteria group bacterium]
MDIFAVWEQSVLSAWSDLSVRFLTFLPVFLGAILVFVVGVLIANWLSKIVEQILRAVKFSDLTKSAGLDAFLKRADIGLDTTGLVAAATRWFIILVFFVATVNILGLTAITIVLNNLVNYIPRIISASLIVAVGVFVANIVEGLVRGALASVDHGHAKPLAHFSRWLVMVVAIMAAVNELQIAQALVETFFQGLTWTVTLAVGLAVGLGSKDMISRILEDWYDNLKK